MHLKKQENEYKNKYKSDKSCRGKVTVLLGALFFVGFAVKADTSYNINNAILENKDSKVSQNSSDIPDVKFMLIVDKKEYEKVVEETKIIQRENKILEADNSSLQAVLGKMDIEHEIWDTKTDTRQTITFRSFGQHPEISGNLISIAAYQKAFNKLKCLKEANQKLNNFNIYLRNMVRNTTSLGTRPKYYKIPPTITSRASVQRDRYGTYIGEVTLSAYTPSVNECGKNDGITNSEHPIIPGFSVAVDIEKWPIGTVFYAEGIGYLMAMDKGDAIKGPNRIDLAFLDKEKALDFGKTKLAVYLVKEGNGKVENVDYWLKK